MFILRSLKNRKNKSPARFQPRTCQHRALPLTSCFSVISGCRKLFNAYTVISDLSFCCPPVATRALSFKHKLM